jgi:hypothetical protein
MSEKEITIRLENYLINGAEVNAGNGIPSSGKTILPSAQSASAPNGFVGGISAQLFVSGARRLISATGETELANTIQETAEWSFLGIRALGGDPTAMATAAFKLASYGIQELKKYQDEQKEIAKSYNNLAILQLQSGQISIKANTVTSYDSYGRLTLTNRK